MCLFGTHGGSPPEELLDTIGFPIETVIIFLVTTAGALWYDLRAHREAKVLPLGSAIRWSVFYVLLAIAFGGWLAYDHGTHIASLFFTGYALEKVLSIDNLIVFSAIFSYFGINEEYRHKVLHYGIIGAVVFRLIFVLIGTGTLALFGPWAEGIFGLIIAWTAVAMLRKEEGKVVDYHSAWYMKLVSKVWPVHTGDSHRFFEPVLDNSYGPRLYMTRLFMCLLAVEASDVVFAFDSVPAVIAVSRDPLIIYSAMIFAILGLRSLYFVLEAMRHYLVHLEKAVIIVLFFIAGKLVVHAGFGMKLDPLHSLAIVLGTLGLGVVASLLFPKRESLALEGD